MLLKEEVGSHALNSHGNYIVDHGKIMKLCYQIFVGTLSNKVFVIRSGINKNACQNNKQGRP